MDWHLNLFLLIWMGSRVNGEEAMDVFINDLVATFQLTSPTILYDNDDEIPEICYASQWVLCLSSNQHESEFPDNPESYRDCIQNDCIQLIGK